MQFFRTFCFSAFVLLGVTTSALTPTPFVDYLVRRDQLPPQGRGHFEIRDNPPAVDIYDTHGKLLAVLRIPKPWAISTGYPPTFIFSIEKEAKLVTQEESLATPYIIGASFGLCDDATVRIVHVAAADDLRHGWHVAVELEVTFPDATCGVRRRGIVCTRKQPFSINYVLLFHFVLQGSTLPEVPVTVKTYFNQKLLQAS